jgi:hypothetical protein
MAQFQRIYGTAEVRTILTEDQLFILHQSAMGRGLVLFVRVGRNLQAWTASPKTMTSQSSGQPRPFDLKASAPNSLISNFSFEAHK